MPPLRIRPAVTEGWNNSRYQSLCTERTSAAAVLAGDHFLYSFFHQLERLPVSPRREGVAISSITRVMLGVPTTLPHFLNQGRRDGVAFNGQ